VAVRFFAVFRWWLLRRHFNLDAVGRGADDDSGVWDRMKDEWTPTSNFSANSSATSHGLARGPSQQ
jgi:hypothetical protein